MQVKDARRRDEDQMDVIGTAVDAPHDSLGQTPAVLLFAWLLRPADLARLRVVVGQNEQIAKTMCLEQLQLVTPFVQAPLLARMQ
jgi:hypothetical protein